MVAATTLAVNAATSVVEATKSRVTATFRQMHVPIEGDFKIFRGSISFDPKHIQTARARIEIDTASFDLGAPEYEKELHGKEWFDTLAYPKAIFVSSRVVAMGGNRFKADGKLMFKGKTQKISVAFTMHSADGARIFEGELPISRKAFAIGSAEWDDTLEDEVIVKFRIFTVFN